MSSWRCLLLIIALSSAVPPSWGAERHSPVETAINTIDDLLQVQDAMAFGSFSAVGEQKVLMRRIDDQLRSTPPEQHGHLVQPVVAYVLSGGDPRFAKELMEFDDIPSRDRSLLEGAALFMQGERAAARRILSRVNPMTLPARLCGRVALARALLEDGLKQQESFAIAIAAMPGTLVEDSALRRSAISYGKAKEKARFWERLERYSRRFSRSIYATKFWHDAVLTMMEWRSVDVPPEMDRLDATLSTQAGNQLRRIYLDMARTAAMANSPQFAELAGRRLYRLALDGSVEQQLGMLYTHLFQITSQDGDRALNQLRLIERSSLESHDRAFLDAALELGHQMERPPMLGNDKLSRADDAKTPLEERGRSLLSETDQLLLAAR